MLTMFAGVGLNAFLNWVFIYGRLGAPRLGLTGAAWATLLTRTLLFAGLLAMVLRSARFRGSLPRRWLAGWSPAQWRAQLLIGAPVALQLLLEGGLFSMAAIMMGWLGAAPLAAHQVAITYAA